MTTCNFCWILCGARLAVIKILSPAVVVSDTLLINYCSKPGWELVEMCKLSDGG